MARPAGTPLLAAVAIAACLLMAAPAAVAKPCENADARSGATSMKDLAAASVCLMNKSRARRGLRPLRMERRLALAARRHSEDMVQRGYFSHVSRRGGNVVSRLRGAGYFRGARAWFVGENLAWGAGWNSTPRAIWLSWMRSSGHRANILQARFRDVGVGVVLQTPTARARHGATYTTTFGMRR